MSMGPARVWGRGHTGCAYGVPGSTETAPSGAKTPGSKGKNLNHVRRGYVRREEDVIEVTDLPSVRWESGSKPGRTHTSPEPDTGLLRVGAPKSHLRRKGSLVLLSAVSGDCVSPWVRREYRNVAGERTRLVTGEFFSVQPGLHRVRTLESWHPPAPPSW